MSEADGDDRRGCRASRVGRTGARFPRTAVDEVEPVAEPEPAGSPDDGPVDTHVGRTGARFNSRTRRARRGAEQDAAEQDAAEQDAAEQDEEQDSVAPAQVPAPAHRRLEADDAPTRPMSIPSPEPTESTRTRVRPYVRTRGRTRARADLAVETLVSIPSPRPALEDPEHVALGDVVGAPRSVAEVAALLSVPLGVARVIIDDMAGAGLLLVHPRAVAATGAPSPDIMQRVLDGLHRL